MTKVTKEEVMDYYLLCNRGDLSASPKERLVLALAISAQRNDRVGAALRECTAWHLCCCPVEDIVICGTIPESRDLFASHRFLLLPICRDWRTLELRDIKAAMAREYPAESSRLVGEVCEEGKVRIIDGMHRVISQTCKGARQFDIYVGRR